MDMSEDPKASDLYELSNKKGYYYKIRSWCDLYNWHDIEFMSRNGHPYNDKYPEIIGVENTESDLRKYYEILFSVLDVEPGKKNMYDIVAMVTNVKGTVPDLGLSFFQLTDFYTCGDLTRGLFIYLVEYDSASYWAGFETGDVIVSAMRPEVEKKPYSLWNKNKYTVTCPDSSTVNIIKQESGYKTYGISSVDELMKMFSWCRDGEHVIFTVMRDGVKVNIEMDVPFKTRCVKTFDTPKIVIKTVPRFEVSGNNLRMNYVSRWNESNKEANENMNNLFLELTCDINDDGYLVMDVPEDMNEVDFYITSDGNLAVHYD